MGLSLAEHSVLQGMAVLKNFTPRMELQDGLRSATAGPRAEPVAREDRTELSIEDCEQASMSASLDGEMAVAAMLAWLRAARKRAGLLASMAACSRTPFWRSAREIHSAFSWAARICP